ncbi:MAG TPA: hypothetical protein VD969_21160 [Symbiobacteriaceae bacterium]|nr:hypothetical protein [Symbiobacteriaceae bacterium]
MKSRLLGLAVVLVALAVIINALALQQADITSTFTVSVVGSGSALIAIAADTDGAQDGDIGVDDTTSGYAMLTVDTGLQPGSTYVFEKAFEIVNNSGDTVDITLPADVYHPQQSGYTAKVSFAVASGDSLSDVVPTGEVGVKMTIELTKDHDVSVDPELDFVITAARSTP